MKPLTRVSRLFAIAFGILIYAPVTIGQQESSALVEKLSGIVLLKRDANAKEKRLNPKTDVGRRLYEGEQVRCGTRGFLRLRLAGSLRHFYGPSGWFTIPRRTPQADRLQKALDEYGRRGGRDRGGEAQKLVVFSPSDGSVASPNTFTIRWVPLIEKCKVSFLIEDANGQQIWRQENVRETTGVLNSKAARRALNQHRTGSDAGPLILIVTDNCGNETEVSFSLLAAADEEVLRKELAHWQRDPGTLTRHLGRAAVFTSSGMFAEAAEEYERALARAPHSHELLMRTIVAQRRIGNLPRELELSKRLPAGIEIP